MTTGAKIFMALSWTFVISLTTWAYRKMLSVDAKPAEDLGPAPAEGEEEQA